MGPIGTRKTLTMLTKWPENMSKHKIFGFVLTVNQSVVNKEPSNRSLYSDKDSKDRKTATRAKS